MAPSAALKNIASAATPNAQRVSHIQEMSTVTVKFEAGDRDKMVRIIDKVKHTGMLGIFFFDMGELDTLVHVKHLLMNAKPDMVF